MLLKHQGCTDIILATVLPCYANQQTNLPLPLINSAVTAVLASFVRRRMSACEDVACNVDSL